jgi:hypothetical protein
LNTLEVGVVIPDSAAYFPLSAMSKHPVVIPFPRTVVIDGAGRVLRG